MWFSCATNMFKIINCRILCPHVMSLYSTGKLIKFEWRRFRNQCEMYYVLHYYILPSYTNPDILPWIKKLFCLASFPKLNAKRYKILYSGRHRFLKCSIFKFQGYSFLLECHLQGCTSHVDILIESLT